MIDLDGFLMMEPTGYNEPIIDSLTRKAAALKANGDVHRKGNHAYKGVHRCSCGAVSDNLDWELTIAGTIRLLTNSLFIHYVACHRDELPEEDREIIDSYTAEVEPSPKDIQAKGETVLRGIAKDNENEKKKQAIGGE